MDFENNKNPVDQLIHLYEDGAFNRRDLIRRVAKYTGSVASAAVLIETMAVPAEAQQSFCLDEVRVPPYTADLACEMVSYIGTAGAVYGYLTRRRDLAVTTQHPAVLVIHENAGLTDHIRDVTRRIARAGFVGLGVDLLSRLGGTPKFPDPADAQRAYGSLSSAGHLEDLLASLEYLKQLNFVDAARIGVTGFCAGGGNCWNVAVASADIKASVVFYGTPPASLDLLDKLNGPVLMNYAELDRNFSGRVPAVVTALNDKRKTYGLSIYEGANHAFHNDTSPRYDAAAACDAWGKTLAWFNKHLRK